MKRYQTVWAAIAAAFMLAAGSSALAANPTKVEIGVIQFAVSTQVDCSSPIVLFGPVSTPVPVDMLVGPALGGGSLPTGTYPCVIITMEDTITFRTGTATGSCSSTSTDYTINVCNGGTQSDTLNGTTVTTNTCNDAAGTPTQTDTVSIWLTTASSTTTGGANSFRRPTPGSTSTTNGFTLPSPFVVTNSSVGQFVADFNGKIDGSGGNCDVQPPNFSFR